MHMGSLPMRLFHHQELLKANPNKATEAGNTNTDESLIGKENFQKLIVPNSNSNQLKESRNSKGKLFYSFERRINTASIRLLVPKLV